MKYGIVMLSQIPVRSEPAHRSEQVSQLLFGETYTVTGTKDEWMRITCTDDNYEGWISAGQYSPLTDREFEVVNAGHAGMALDMASTASSTIHSIPILAGSTLPGFDGMNFKIGKEKFIYNGQALLSENRNPAVLERVALRYLNAPYLWGGRSPFGIDCSGFTQVVFKFCGMALKRDAYLQAEQGSTINFVEETQTGDLAFFANEENRIVHVGIVLKDQRIIHASGKVRIDKLDHFGIYSTDAKKYTHQLKVLKRLF